MRLFGRGRSPSAPQRVFQSAGVLALFAFIFTFAPSAFASANPSRYTLTEARSQATSGPFTLFDGARIRLDGTLYTLSVGDDHRLTFTSSAGSSFGPYQAVPGRIMQIGQAMYSFAWAGTSSFNSESGTVPRAAAEAKASAPRAATQRAEPIATFDPMPPPPERIEIPPEVEHRTVPALDMPALPDASRPFALGLWYAPIDRNTLKWKVESVSGREVDFERTSFGADFALNSWFLGAACSTSGKSGAIVPSGLGFTGSSIDDASGFSITLGYKRPFIEEGGWIASAGIQGRIRREKGDISTTALVATGEVDTNDVGNVISEYKSRTSEVTITEQSLRIDFELGYRQDSFYGFAGLALQPFSSVSVSGKLPYGDDDLKISAKHDDAIGAVVGASLDLPADFRVFADFTFIFETRLRIGLSRSF